MARYLAKERPLTLAESLTAYRARIQEAEEEMAEATARLNEAINAEPPTTVTDYVEVKPGETGYEDAPFENTIIMNMRNAISTKTKAGSPWTDLVERGEYPGGLSKL